MSYLKQTTGMGTWRARKLLKGARGRQESGRSKGIIAEPLFKTICRRNRSWKHPMYEFVMSKLTGEKRRKGK